MGSKCAVHQCLVASGDKLFEAKIDTSASARQITQVATSSFSPGIVVDFTREIHFSVKETVVGLKPDQGNVQVQIQKLFDIQRGVTETGKVAGLDQLTGKPIDLKQIILCRFKFDNQADVWHELKAEEQIVKFYREQSTITFQFWTNVGMVVEKSFKVIIHPPIKVNDVCGEFIQKSFYQTLKNPRCKNENQYCNVPGSDFAEVTLDITHMHNLHAIQCDLFFTDGPAQTRMGKPALLFKKNGNAAGTLKRYAIDLIKNPTEATTSVEFRCEMDGSSGNRTCSHFIDLLDCDPPEFGNALAKCSKDCKANKVLPYSACGGNRISLKRQTGAILSNDQLECCEQCNTDLKSFQCFGLTGKNVPYEQDIGRCESVSILRESSALLMKAISSPQYIALLVGAVACIALFSIGFRNRYSNEDELNPSGYRPLL